ncbi:MAG: hypothetical protein SPI01_03960 [Succiniclasticum sp.]|nr:hypothetical protein [Succiniclasticum sp.]MDY6087137.1 hypothetical protein [Succiniclasticum sp.]
MNKQTRSIEKMLRVCYSIGVSKRRIGVFDLPALPGVERIC